MCNIIVKDQTDNCDGVIWFWYVGSVISSNSTEEAVSTVLVEKYCFSFHMINIILYGSCFKAGGRKAKAW